MAHFYGTVNGQARTTASRIGSKGSGIQGHIRGWGIGGRVRCYVNEDGEDEVAIYLTSGSGGYGCERLLGKFTRSEFNA